MEQPLEDVDSGMRYELTNSRAHGVASDTEQRQREGDAQGICVTMAYRENLIRD
jgi:hypothetical protein